MAPRGMSWGIGIRKALISAALSSLHRFARRSLQQSGKQSPVSYFTPVGAIIIIIIIIVVPRVIQILKGFGSGFSFKNAIARWAANACFLKSPCAYGRLGSEVG